MGGIVPTFLTSNMAGLWLWVLLIVVALHFGSNLASDFTATAEARTWTNTDGDTIQADLIKIRGRTVFLDQNGKTIRAPIPKLSEADQAWIEKYQSLKGSRNWTLSTGDVIEGRYGELTEDAVVVKRGYERSTLKLEELSEADRQYLRDYLPMIEEEVPEAIRADESSQLAEAQSLGSQSQGTKPSDSTGPSDGTGDVQGKADSEEMASEKPTELVTDEDEAPRAWHDSRGREIMARLVRFDGELVTLFLKEREYKLPLTKLSEEDQNYLSQRLIDTVEKPLLSAEGTDAESALADDDAASQPTADRLADSKAPVTEPLGPMSANETTNADAAERAKLATVSEPVSEGATESSTATSEMATSLDSADEAELVSTEVDKPTAVEESSVPEEPTAEVETNDGIPPEGIEGTAEGFASHPNEPPLGEDVVLALCEECENISRMPTSFAAGDPCPHCNAKVNEVIASTDLFSVGYEDEGSGSWIPGRTLRRLIWLVLFLIIGAAAKFFTASPE